MNNKKNQDLSIEEILKSIRGIINNDGSSSKVEDSEDVLELTDVASSSLSQTRFVTASATDETLRSLHDDSNRKSLISEKSASETSTILKSFAKQATNAVKESKKRQPTVEEFIVEMMKPELSCWLDKHLPTLVHKIVEQEIKRLIPHDDDDS